MGEAPANLPHRQGHRQYGATARSRFSQAQHYAALDLGTNNCRLLIARPSANGFTVIDAFSRIVRLGEGLASTGRISDAAIERTLSALSVCASKLRRRNVTLSRAVATEACRRATNGAEFIARAQAETGIVLDIISAEEEARLAVLGCHVLIEDVPPSASDAILQRVNGVLRDRFHIAHSTVQFEHMSCAISETGCAIPVDFPHTEHHHHEH